jgi:hypothetical protein
MSSKDQLNRLRQEIESRGAPDNYIDEDEEATLFESGKRLGLDRDTVEALLNQMCQSNHWTREKDVVADLRDELSVVAGQSDGIDKKQFEHCVNFAVAMHMPRKRAVELSVRFVVQNQVRIKKGWLAKDWFLPLRRQYTTS